MKSIANGRSGPLSGVKVLQIASLAPGPFACMMLADLGAEVLRVERPVSANPDTSVSATNNVLERGQNSIVLDLKQQKGRAAVLRLVTQADVLVEGFRPGTMERLGLGPKDCSEQNPKLIYGRMTGWGQSGPLSRSAGHDINYIALSGALYSMGPKGRPPTPPLNLVGDFGGGGLFLAYGIVCALYEREISGKGQIVDASMVDGSSLLLAQLHGLIASGDWRPARGENILDGGVPWYNVYETSDGKFVSIGAIEAKFYAEFMSRLGLEDAYAQYDRASWPELTDKLVRIFRTKTRDEWCRHFDGSDACFAPVLSPKEAPHHPHAVERGSFVDVGGIVQPSPGPRFSRTPAALPGSDPFRERNSERILEAWGFSSAEMDELFTKAIVRNERKGAAAN
jgi:alpha-methylacyl-CoA racemase